VAEWDPDVAIDEALVRALLAEQFPTLEARSLQLLGEGFDNSVWVIDEEWAFRFPRRAQAVPLVDRELAVLPRLADLVPAPIPIPAFVGEPSEFFPRPFFGHGLLAGVEPADACLTAADRVRLGVGIARFLRALHAPRTRSAVDPERALPVDPNRRADMPFRVEKAREWLDRLPDLASRHRSAAERILADGELLEPTSDEALVHGDLHARHVLVDAGELSGVIDWGDVCLGDPAIDLPFVWSVVPPESRHVVLDEYGAADDEARLRARVLAIMLSAVLILCARHEGRATLERESVAGLERALTD
jgi:aminoglycoside phosphotransferase (APT) family kinase protein